MMTAINRRPADDKALSAEGRAPRLKAIGIGSSTGGPNALVQVLSGWGLRGGDQPIFITQHMPASFTQALAQQLTIAAGRLVQEPEDGERIMPGKIYIAPGDRHMTMTAAPRGPVIHIDDGPPINFCRPSVDPMLHSLAEVYGANAMALVLTGMGRDGCDGAGAVKAAGGRVLAQDQSTSVVWGMPGAVVEAGLADAEIPLHELSIVLAEMAGGRMAR